MTPRQVAVLADAARDDDVNPGSALLFEQQRGRIRQVKWLLGRKLVRMVGGRIVATKTGRKVLDHQLSH